MSPFEIITRLISFSLFSQQLTANGQQPTANGQDWQQLFDESRCQAVTALLYDAILMLPKEQRPPRSVLFHFMSMTKTIESDNRQRHQALLDFDKEVMQPLGISTVVIKGSSLACLYPQPLHRECGDNDLYTGADTDRLAAHLQSIGIDVDRKDPRHISFIYHDVDFEAHSYLLYHHDDPEWKTLAISHWPLANSQEPRANSLLTFPPSDHAFFLAKHIEHHAVFFHKPVRLRDIIDWCILLRTEGFDFNRFRQLKKGTDVEHFAELMTLYGNTILGLEIPCQPPQSITPLDFDRLYMQCPERHPLAIVRVARRSWKYIRFHRQYRTIYGKSMFLRFYIKNIIVALKNLTKKR